MAKKKWNEGIPFYIYSAKKMIITEKGASGCVVEMNVMYTCDDHFVSIAGISMLSLLESNKDIEQLTVYLVAENVKASNIEKLQKSFQQYRRKLIVIDVTNMNIPLMNFNTRWPKIAYMRIFCAQLLPTEIDKVLYLDCDTLIRHNLQELWDWPMVSVVISGVKDCISKQYKKNIGIGENSDYVNAGVLIIDLVKLRQVNLESKISSFFAQYAHLVHYADQDILNGIFQGRIGVLPAKYNVTTLLTVYNYEELICLRHPAAYYAECEVLSAKQDPYIVHFTTCMQIVRPWYETSNHPFAFAYYQYKDKSVWKEDTLQLLPRRQPKDFFFSFMNLFSSRIQYPVLGWIHSKAFPVYKRVFCRLKNKRTSG